MEKNRNLKKWMLPIGHALLVNATVATLTFLYHGKVIGDAVSLFLLFAALAIFAPVFFWMKPRDVAPWKSDLITACAHLVLNAVLWLIAEVLELGWTNAMLYFATQCTWVFYACLIGLDIIIALFRKNKR